MSQSPAWYTKKLLSTFDPFDFLIRQCSWRMGTQGELEHVPQHMHAPIGIYVFKVFVSPHYCQLYLWFLKLSTFKFYFKSVLFIQELLRLQAAPPFCWRVLPTCVRSVWLSLLYQTHHFRKQIKPVGSKEAVLLMEQMHINFNLFYQFFLICIDRKKVTYYFLIPFVSELLNMLIQVSF